MLRHSLEERHAATTKRIFQNALEDTEALHQYLESDPGVTLDDLGIAPWTETVRLKDTAKHLIEYEDNDTTAQMRAGLERLNALLADTVPTLDDGSASGQDISAKRLYRVFNNGSFDKGSRFYDGWWMSVPSADRSHILIDGEVTVELDTSAMTFKASHYRLKLTLTPIPAGGASRFCKGWLPHAGQYRLGATCEGK